MRPSTTRRSSGSIDRLSRLSDAAPILLLLSALPLGGCPAILPPNLREATIKPSDLPESAEETLRWAEDESKKETAAAEENVIIAVDHGLDKDGKSYELLWRGARACAWLTEEFIEKNICASY